MVPLPEAKAWGDDFGCKVKTLSLYYNIFYLFFCECRLNLLILHRANVQESALDNMVAKITIWSFLSHEMGLPMLCRMEKRDIVLYE